MIHEYAIDPAFLLELADKSETSLHLCRALALGSACIMAGYPDNIGSLAYSLAKQELESAKDPKHIEKWQKRLHKVTEITVALTQTTTKRFNCKSWNQDFTDEHTRFPFAGILSNNLPADNAPHKNLDWLRRLDCDLFTCPQSCLVPRKADDMNRVLLPLLQNASQLTFVDPYFYPEKRFNGPYQKYFASIAAASHVRSSGVREINIVCTGYIELYGKEHKASTFQKACEVVLPKLMPPNMKLTIYRIKEIPDRQKRHNRYIITDIGGVSLGHGTDDSSSLSSDDIGLLSAPQLAHWKAAYTPGSAHFDWTKPPVIVTHQSLRNSP